MTMRTSDPVVLGVSGSPAGQAALRTAIEEATARHAPLHLVRVWRELDWFPSATEAGTADLRESERADRALLAATAALARHIAPELLVTAEFATGDVYAVLEARAVDASLVVVGARTEGDPGPIGHWLAEHAPAPVRTVTVAARPGQLARSATP